MNFDSLGVVFDLIMFLGCAYCGYSWFWMRQNGRIHKNPILITQRTAIEDCKDTQGYLRYISPRLLVFSIVGVFFGGVNLYGNYRGLPPEVWLLAIGILLVNIIWFAFVIHQSVKRFWDPEPQIRL